MRVIRNAGGWVVKNISSEDEREQKDVKQKAKFSKGKSKDSKAKDDAGDVGRGLSSRGSDEPKLVTEKRKGRAESHSGELKETSNYSSDDEFTVFEQNIVSSNSEGSTGGLESRIVDSEEEESFGSSTAGSEDEGDRGQKRTLGTLPKTKYPVDKLPEIDPVYDSATSDEDNLNTVGNIDMKWYDEYEHIGYDKDGNKVNRSEQFADQNEVSRFLSLMEDPKAWRSVKDQVNGRHIELTEEQLNVISRVNANKFPDESYNPYEPTVEWFTGKTEMFPLSAAPEPKRRYIPSKHEAKMIMKIARGIRKGHYKSKDKQEGDSSLRDIWAEAAEEQLAERPLHIPAPKMKLPGNALSYNPPAEYLFTPEEEKKWHETDEEQRTLDAIPQKFSALRHVPAYERFIQERFKRCLDLYLCPRTIKNRIDINPDSLLPELPDPSELEPYPKFRMLEFFGHKGRVRCCSVDPTGLWLATGAENGTLRVWEIRTGRCMRTYRFGKQIDDTSEESKDAFSDSEAGPLGGSHDRVSSVAWHPNRQIHLLLVAVGQELQLLCPALCSQKVEEATLELFTNFDDFGKSLAKWSRLPQPQRCASIALNHFPTSVVWHRKGDYFASVASRAQTSSALLVHRISQAKSQAPFHKAQGLIQKAMFHPTLPLLFVATQRHVKRIDLKSLTPPQILLAGVKWISSMDIHPSGNHLVVGSYDRRLCWFDLDLGLKPWKVLRYSSTAIRAVQFHPQHPLFASVSDSGELHLFHARVFNEAEQDPLIIPVKVLQAHNRGVDHLGALDCFWHPKEPWVVTTGVDGQVRMFCP